MTEEEVKVVEESTVDEVKEEAVEEVITPSIEERLASLEGQLKSIVEIGQAQEMLIKDLRDQIIALQSLESEEPKPEPTPVEVAEATMLEKAGF